MIVHRLQHNRYSVATLRSPDYDIVIESRQTRVHQPRKPQTGMERLKCVLVTQFLNAAVQLLCDHPA